MAKVLDRAAELAGLWVREVDCSAVPANRMAALARHGWASSATALQGLAEQRRTATLLAMARHLDAVVIDDALDLFALLMTTRLINPARTASNTARLASLPRLERASRTLARVGRELLRSLERSASDDGLDVAAVWSAVGTIASREQIAGALAVVDELVSDDDDGADAAMRVALGERYTHGPPPVGKPQSYLLLPACPFADRQLVLPFARM